MINIEKNVDAICTWLNDYLQKSGAKGFALGISGGKDSAVVAGLLVKAVGKENVIGVLMPNGLQADIDDSIKVCEGLDIKYEIVNIKDAYEGLVNALPSIKNRETKINITPRIRMTTVYAVASEHNYLVCGTGNKSEGFVGYFTKYGDGGYDINPISDFTTDEVVKIGEYLNVYDGAIHKVPSDGISGVSDEEKLGFSYNDVNSLIENGRIENKKIESQILDRNAKNEHKRVMPPTFKKIK